MREAVERIRAAEADAERAKRLAREKADSELAGAGENGKKYVEAAVSEADRAAAGLIKEAEKKALSIAEEKIREAERETASLMKTAQSRIDRASAVIVEGIVGGI